MGHHRIGIVITTKNRREILRHTLQRAMEQDNPNCLIAVFDDASTDATAEMIQTEFPTVRLERNEAALGYIVNRNRAASLLCDCKYLISLDDDSWPLKSDAASRVLDLFALYPDAALLSFEIFGSYHLPLEPEARLEGKEIASFAGCGYAVDRERFLQLGGFPECFEFYGEENDFILRVMNAGWTCRFAPTVPIFHAETLSGRNEDRIREFSLANTLTHFWLREPFYICVPHTLYVIVHRGLKWGIAGHLGSFWTGIRRWLSRSAQIRTERSPVTFATIRRYRALQKRWRDYILARRSSTSLRQPIALPSCLENRR